jgi:4-hydroxybenzoate polyprenyltransferase
MSSPPRTERREAGIVIIVALLLIVLLPALYVLSIGPMFWFYQGPLPDAWMAFYAPLIWLDDQVPLCRRFFEWYVDLWVD